MSRYKSENIREYGKRVLSCAVVRRDKVVEEMIEVSSDGGVVDIGGEAADKGARKESEV